MSKISLKKITKSRGFSAFTAALLFAFLRTVASFAVAHHVLNDT